MFSKINQTHKTGALLISAGLVFGISWHPPVRSSKHSLQALGAESTTPLSQTIYVNTATGTDSTGAGSTEAVPYKTITHALSRAQSGTVIQLAPGTYTAETGEVFPLTIKPGVTLKGDESNQGQLTAIIGGDRYISPTLARQDIAVRAENDSTIVGVTISNPNQRGTALWIESSNPTVKHSTFANSHREGIFVTGSAAPKIFANVFSRNGGNGISVVRSAKGEIHNNLFEANGFGLAIAGTASPSVVENQIVQNKDGVVISEEAHPTLRSNLIMHNQRDGFVVAGCSKAKPDLGTASTPGRNIFSDNARYDIHNGGQNSLVVLGSQLEPNHLAGSVGLGLEPLPTVSQVEPQHCW